MDGWPLTKTPTLMAFDHITGGYDPDIKKATDACQYIAEGDSVRKASAKAGIEPTKFYRLLAKDENLVKQYAGARASRADARVEGMDDVIDEMKAGTIDANQARVIMDAIKWQAGKENAKRYGDKIEVEQKGEVTVKHKWGQ